MIAQTLIKGFERINSTGIADYNAIEDLPPITNTDYEQSILDAVTQVGFHSLGKGGFRLNSHFCPRLTTRLVCHQEPKSPQNHH
jgi:hypothetical protein